MRGLARRSGSPDVARTGAALPGRRLDWPGGWSGGLLLAVGHRWCVVLVGRPAARVTRGLCAACVLLLLLAVVRPRAADPGDHRLAAAGLADWRCATSGRGTRWCWRRATGPAVVVDAGPDPVLVDRCLRALGVTRVPLLVLTHFHADHVAGLPGVLRGRAVGAIQTTALDEPPEQARFVRRAAAGRQIPMVRAAPGERRRTGRLAWQVLWPPPRPAPDPDGPNDASVTLLVRTAA